MPVTPDTKGQVSPILQNITWERGTAFPTPANLLVQSTNAEFVEVYLQFIGTSVSWINVDGYTGNSFYLLDFSIAQTLVLSLQNLNLLTSNNYKAVLQFRFSKAEGADKLLEVEINLALSGSTGIQTEKSSYSVTFNRANGILSGDTVVNILNNGSSKILSFWQPSNIFEPKSGFTNSFAIENNTALSIAVNPDVPNTGTINHQCKLLGPAGEQLSTFAVNLLILDANGIGVNPSSLAFEVVKNTTEKTAVLSVINPLGVVFTLQTPSWLIPSVPGASGTVDITFTTSTNLLNAGIFSDVIKILFAGGSIDVPVTLLLKQFITIGQSNFCLDLLPLIFTKINDAARYVKVTLQATYTVMGVVSYFNRAFVIPYINDQASFELGKKLHQYFPRYRDHLFNIAASTEFMKAISCDLILEELTVDYENIFTETLANLTFFPGKEPKMFPILTNFEFRKKNKGSILFITHAEAEILRIDKLTDMELTNSVTYGGKTLQLYNFPDVYKTIYMQWENQNLVPDWFTFTGEYTINADFSHITSKNVLNSLLEKFETSDLKKLQINTGFMMKKEMDMVWEMINSRLSFIKIDEKIYRCFNVTPKINLGSSAETLIEKDFEFIIVEE
ncbi:MAG: hypothetical protein ACOH1X_03020 [Kaistella sp.]